LHEVSVQREGQVDGANTKDQDVANVLDALDVALWNPQSWGWHNLLPTKASMHHEHKDREQIEHDPVQALEELELQLVNVTDWHWIDGLLADPKQLKLWDAKEIDHVRRWSHQVWLSGTEAELEQVNGHEG